MTVKQTPKERAAIDFWDDVTLIEVMDAPLNFWDRRSWWQKLLLICVAVVVCVFVGGMVAGVLVGYAK